MECGAGRNGRGAPMSNLLCFGLGYSAEHFVGLYGDGFARIVATVRGAERAALLSARLAGRLKALVFDGHAASPELLHAVGEADAALISIPQDETGDPALRACGEAFEQAWQDFGRRRGIAVAILRLAGIYGPGRSALTQIARGDARRIVKPDQIFNRIHVDDIAQAIDAAFARKASGIFNVADDDPTPPGDPLLFAAQLLGTPPPPEVAYEDAAPTMSPLAKSFWQECRRVRNDKLKRTLGVTLRYPTYREGLRALFEQRGR